jgi:subtilase family serine protease
MAFAAGAAAQQAEIRQPVGPGLTLVTPPSSQPGKPGTVHTHFKFLVRANRPADSQPSGTSETPASLACVYGLTKTVAGCNPETLTTVATGGSRSIAIVDAYDDPTATSDLRTYSRYFGLPAITTANFRVVYAQGKKPPVDSTGAWEGEESLDVQMAHAAAPNAKIYLVEANSPGFADMYSAVQLAGKLVAADGGGEVSTSWGGDEYAGEAADDHYFVHKGVVFFNAAGDTPGDEAPAAFEDVVTVGGADITRSVSGDYTGQIIDGNSAGGLSSYIVRPSYQNGIANLVGGARGTPDVGLVDFVVSNDTKGGVWVYDGTPYNGTVPAWAEIAGTSVGAPLLAGLVNNTGSFLSSSRDELAAIYLKLGEPIGYVGFSGGACINEMEIDGLYLAGPGWNPCTGVGVPFALKK